jgi:hypothetical protein
MKKLLLLIAFLLLLVLPWFCTHAQSSANQFTSNTNSGTYAFGLNPGWYSTAWSTQRICDLGSEIGAHSFRMQLYDSYLSKYGLTSLLSDYEHLQSMGAKEIAVMVGGVSDEHKWNPFNQTDTWNGVTYDAGKLFKGMYEPIWNGDGSVNPQNTYAQYLYDVVTTYGRYVTYWEVWNEPDFTYSSAGWEGATTWFTRDPTAEELVNLRATVPYYVRLLRISWEVIKRLCPEAHVCTGGLGINGFLAALLRLTDNPVDGSVTQDYPLKGGAYFDVLSFHTYPEFSYDVKHWDNALGGQLYNRHSDAAVAGHFRYKQRFSDLLSQAGYNGVTYPKKLFICTETGMSRVMDNDNVGSVEIQRNYLLKCHVKTLMEGTIRQTYWYQTGDTGEDHWGQFGCYFDFSTSPSATLSNQGKALQTLSSLLYGATYDEAKTAALHLPSTVDGGAFKRASGEVVYCLWAKTSTDLSEQAFATLTLPASKKTAWDGSVSSVSGITELSGTPAFFEPLQALPIQDNRLLKPPAKKRYEVKIYNQVYQYLGERREVELSELKRTLRPGMYILYYKGQHEFFNKVQ